MFRTNVTRMSVTERGRCLMIHWSTRIITTRLFEMVLWTGRGLLVMALVSRLARLVRGIVARCHRRRGAGGSREQRGLPIVIKQEVKREDVVKREQGFPARLAIRTRAPAKCYRCSVQSRAHEVQLYFRTGFSFVCVGCPAGPCSAAQRVFQEGLLEEV